MVDVGGKPSTQRRAVAEGYVHLSAEALQAITAGTVHKGNVLLIAQLAGIQGAKRTADLIPLCHPLPIDSVSVTLEPLPEDGMIRVEAAAQTCWRTGVEMEAITAVMTAALTVYDMVKSIDRSMSIGGVRLLEKHGGSSGSWSARQ
jgi:cyclic pyranopterin phosphate synthase